MFIEAERRNSIQAPSGAACLGFNEQPRRVGAIFLAMPLLRSLAAFNDRVAINMALLTEVRQGKLGCSEGESPSRLMEELVFRTKEMNGKV
jgi:hypothetical protein